MISQHKSSTRRGVSLIEAVIVVVVLAIAVPPSFILVQEAVTTRADAVQTTRASILAQAVVEHVLADVFSDAPGLGYDALADADAWLDAPGSGLRERIAATTGPYEQLGFSYEVGVSAEHDATGSVSGEPGFDVFRTVTVTVSWPLASGGVQTGTLSVVVTAL